MKKLLLTALFAFLLTPVIWSADANPVIELGSVLTDGGAGHMARSISFEMNVKQSGDYVNKIRTGYYQWLNNNPEVAGIQVWNINQVYLLGNVENGWKFYGAMGFGGNNEINNGDDALRGGMMAEFGCHLFGKIPFGVGGKLYPVVDKGDQVFVYGMLSISLP